MPCLLPLVLALLAGAPQTWTVDDDGPADFSEIADAIASPTVLDGDVVVVEPGAYAAFVLDRNLKLLAPAGALFTTTSCTVDGAPAFTIAGLATPYLLVQNVPGRAHLDVCSVGKSFVDPGSGYLLTFGRAIVQDCDDVLVTRCTLRGSDGCYPDVGANDAGLQVIGSNVAVFQSILTGGEEIYDQGAYCGYHPVFGHKAGLLATDGSQVVVSHSSLVAGNSYPGFEEAGLHLVDSVALVSGSAHDVVGGPTASVDGSGSSAHLAGVSLSPPSVPAWVDATPQVEPYFLIPGATTPGKTVRVAADGPAGTPVLVVLSLGATAPLPTPYGPLWLDQALVVWTGGLATTGAQPPAFLPLTIPAQQVFVGLSFVFEGLALVDDGGGGGELLLTAPAGFVVRP